MFFALGCLAKGPSEGLICAWTEDEGVGVMPAVPGLDGAESFTVSIRASWDNPRQKGYPNLFSSQGWGGDGGMLFFVTQGRLSFRVGSGTGKWHETEFAALPHLPDNEWKTITVTFQRPVFTVYVDGKKVRTGNWNEPFRMSRGFQLGGWGNTHEHQGRLDDLRIYNRALSAEEVSSLAEEGNWKGRPLPRKPAPPAIVLDGAKSVMELDSFGRLASVRIKEKGCELLERPLPFVAIVREKGGMLSTRHVERIENKLVVTFPRMSGEVVLSFHPIGNQDGWSFAVESATVTDIKEIVCARVLPSCKKWLGTMGAIFSDEKSAIALRAYDVALEMRVSPLNGLSIAASKDHGLVGGRFGLVAGPRTGFVEQLRAMSKDSGAPLSSSGGAWALGSEANRGSYVFADLSLASVDDWIDLAERGGFEYVHLHGWWDWLGQYPVRKTYFPNGLEDMKAAVDKIHAAGLKAGMHSLTACINPHRDPWISPICTTNLVADAVYSLAAPVSIDATEILVNECPIAKHDLVYTYSSNGNFLRLGNEVVQYTGIRREKPYAFTGCRRGFFKTVPAAYAAGARCDYLHQRYNAFYPDPDSPLADDLATRLANVRNFCGIDFFYFDGSEGMGTRYGIDKLRRLIYGHFSQPPVAEASCWGAHNWWFHSRLGAWDHSVWGAKRFHDKHVRTTIESSRLANFLEPQMGWWQPRVGSAAARGHFSEEMEYFAAKNAGHDAAMSQQGVNVTGAPMSEFLSRQFTLMGWYERFRLARAFAPGVQERLSEPRTEFRLRQGDDGVWKLTQQTSIVHRVQGPESLSWTLDLAQDADATLRLEALYGAAPRSVSTGTNFLSVADIPQMSVSQAAAVKAVLETGEKGPEDSGPSIRFSAVNSGTTSRGAWAGATRLFSFPYMSLGTNAAFGMWVKGDGSGTILNLQLQMAREYHGGIGEHYVKLDFTGWRYVTLLARERDADAFADLFWPYGGGYASVFRNPYDARHIAGVALYLNEIPPGGRCHVEVADIRACAVAKPTLCSSRISVNGQPFDVPFKLHAGEYAELEDGRWILYSEKGESLQSVKCPELRLQAGANEVVFTGETDANVPPRVEVTFLVRGTPFAALDPQSRGCPKLAYEAMLPFRYAPTKGFDETPPLAIRPGETARLELTVFGPIDRPSFDFGETGIFEFPVSLKADERLLCKDGRNWRVIGKDRKIVSEGVLSVEIPCFPRSQTWKFRSSSSSEAQARIELVKRYTIP